MSVSKDVGFRAVRAKQLLEDPLFIESLDAIEKEIIEQWEACPARDVEGRESIWRYYKTAKKFRGILQGVVESGKMAQFREQSMKENIFNVLKKPAA